MLCNYRLACLLLALPIVLCLSGCRGNSVSRESGPPEYRNIVVITVDTLRADRLGAYGYDKAKTPNIDALAARGVLFTNATTPLPRTTPAVASLLTGLWPKNHGSRDVGTPVRSVSRLPQILAARGFATLGVASTRALSAQMEMHRGFDEYVVRNYQAENITHYALTLVDQQPEDKPIFLWVHYFDPHFQYDPPSTWVDQPAADKCRALQRAMRSSAPPITLGQLQSDFRQMASRAVVDCAELYDAEIAYTDYYTGVLLDGLRKRSRLDNALVIFNADHGESFGEQSVYFEHGTNVHDSSLRVPLIIAGDGIEPRRDTGTVALEDLMPTVLSLLRVPPGQRPQSDGSDISSRLVGGVTDSSAASPLRFAESGSTFHWDATHSIFAGHKNGPRCIHDRRFSLCGHETIEKRLVDRPKDPRCLFDVSDEYPEEKKRLMAIWDAWLVEEKRELTVRNERFKLTRFPLLNGGYRSELYDLKDTDGADRNVIDAHPEIASELTRALDEWAQDRTQSDEREIRSPEELETLRALGYL